MGILTPKEYLATFGAVEVSGPKWCGKTWTSLAFAESVIHLDDWEVKALVEADLSIALNGKQPHLIDEWQETPQIRDAVRRSVDTSGNKPGAYILTGSAAPTKAAKERVLHSGAGRIGRLRMRPMSLFEMGHSSGIISLSRLFDGIFEYAEKETGIEELALHVCCGGWPAVKDMDPVRAQKVARQYIDEMISYTAEKTGKRVSVLHGLLRSISRNIGVLFGLTSGYVYS